MKWSIASFKIIYRVFIIGSHFILVPIQAHMAILPGNDDFYKIYSLDHNPTELFYHLASGTVHKQEANGLQSVHRHAHVVSGKVPAHATILGYINKNKNDNSAQQQYVYIEPNKIK